MPAQEIEVVSPSELVKNEELLARVDSLIDEARTSEEKLHRDFLEIGVAMLEVQRAKAWLLVARSWDSYVMDCGKRFGRGRTALYSYVSVAERLLPHMPAKQLVEMGISKAQPLAAFVKKTGKTPTAALIESASDPDVGVEQFRATVAESTHEKPEKGKWRELSFFASEDEWLEIETALKYAEIIDEVPVDTPDWAKKKRAIVAMSRECISSWGPEIDRN